MNPSVLKGLEAAVNVLEDQFGIVLARHTRRCGSRHEFASASGHRFRLPATDLARVWAKLDRNVVGEHEIHHLGETHSVRIEADNLRYTAGDDYPAGGTVVGHIVQHGTKTKFRGSDTMEVRARQVVASFTDNGAYMTINATDYSGDIVYDAKLA